MADIIQIAEQLNSEVTRLNNERSKMEGMLESAKTNYEKAVKAYELKYGVKLSEDTLQQEYNNVFARTKGAILDLQEKIESIKRGDYKKDVEEVEYDLEPEVEPIRAEVKPEPEKKRRGRKPKAEAKPEVVVPVEEVKIEEEVEDIDDVSMEVPTEDTSVFTMPVESAPVEVASVEETPFKLDFDFGGFGDNTTVSVPNEPKAEPKKEEKIKGSQGRKPLSFNDISAAVAASETVKQTPVTMPNISDDDDDEVELSDFSFGSKPTSKVAEPTSDFGFGSFGDLGGFGGFDAPKAEPKKEEPKKSEPDMDFGGFGGFGGFGDLNDSNNDVEDEDDIEDVIPGDGFSFGGLGDFGMTSETPKAEPKKQETITPEGWGADLNFGDFGDFGSILNSKDFKFGE